ncbi:Bifunctional protein ArgHA [Halomicronema hongdechloris C2206]|uniref:Bifunctional protein ArgHA n=1 Tax=Halomicronema hongdechloris C2206 TaxID=1641165 RepID=A0A1Z3HNQ7_9CYAN|nr:arsenic resistance N-acetyltransferase ArsN2 [Halomicronema hongdechloris]ASC71797.1 Bifunctional protein ArgHA [Halomicronema hongdechloris C2206]
MVSQLPGLYLRSATVADQPLIQTWLGQHQLPTEDLSDILDCLYLGVQGNDIVGIGGIERHGEDGLLRSLVIAPSWQGQGYGQRLCRQLIQQAQFEGLQALYLLTNTAPHFFAKLGFACIERQFAPTTIQQTTEFASLCPDSAICMQLLLPVSESSPLLN